MNGGSQQLDWQLDTLKESLLEHHESALDVLSESVATARRLQDELIGLRMENKSLQAQLSTIFASPQGAGLCCNGTSVLAGEETGKSNGTAKDQSPSKPQASHHSPMTHQVRQPPPLPPDIAPPEAPHPFLLASEVQADKDEHDSHTLPGHNGYHERAFTRSISDPSHAVAKKNKPRVMWDLPEDAEMGNHAVQSTNTTGSFSKTPKMGRSKTGLGPGKSLFMDSDTIKAAIRAELIKKEVTIGELYKKDGIFQFLARHPAFEICSTIVVTLNAIWIAVDTDLNDAPSLLQARAEFQIVEQLFCLYFSFEWVVRFMAFQVKRDVTKDKWFMFETGLVAMMVLETWLITGGVLIVSWVTGGGTETALGGGSAILRILRLLRLNRAARIARVLNAIPELMVLVKGIITAARSVFFTIALMMGIIYVFAVAFRELAKGTDLEDDHFRSVPWSMTMLLLWGAFPDLVDTVYDIGQSSPYLAMLFVGFIFLVSLTVMNMLIGVLVEMVSMVAAVEKEEIEVSFVKNKFLSMLPVVDEDGNMMISKTEFEILLAQPECWQALQSVGVDVMGLIDLTDFIYMNADDESEGLSFEQIMDMILNLRQKNKATVKDIVDLRKYITWNMSLLQDQLEKMVITKLKPNRGSICARDSLVHYHDSSRVNPPIMNQEGMKLRLAASSNSRLFESEDES